MQVCALFRNKTEPKAFSDKIAEFPKKIYSNTFVENSLRNSVFFKYWNLKYWKSSFEIKATENCSVKDYHSLEMLKIYKHF